MGSTRGRCGPGWTRLAVTTVRLLALNHPGRKTGDNGHGPGVWFPAWPISVIGMPMTTQNTGLLPRRRLTLVAQQTSRTRVRTANCRVINAGATVSV